MKKYLSLLMMSVLCVGAWAATSSLIFTKALEDLKPQEADDGVVWTIKSAPNDFTEGYDDVSGIQFGSSKSPATWVEFSTEKDAFKGTITNIVVNARDVQEVATVSVSVGDVPFTCSGSTTATNTSADFEFSGTGSGNIIVRIDRGQQMNQAIYVKSIIVTYDNGEGESTKYALVTSANELLPGKNYIIVNVADKDVVAMAEQKNNNRGASAEEFNDDNTISPSAAAQIIMLENENGGWYFNVGDGYLYAASSSGNQLKTEAEKDEDNNSKAAITIDEDGIASIVFQGTHTRNVLQYNSGNSLFACYASASQSPVKLYKEVEEGTVSYSIEPDNGAGEYLGSVTVKATVTPEMPEHATLTYTFAEAESTEPPQEQAYPEDGVTLTQSGTLTFIARDANNAYLAIWNGDYTITPLIGDFDGDGKVSVSDLNYLVNIILGKINPNAD